MVIFSYIWGVIFKYTHLIEFRLMLDNRKYWVNVGLKQVSVMSLWLFNVYMDGVVREVNVWVHGKGLGLLSANCFGFEINQLLFADDTALLADSEEKLCRLVSEFGRVRKKKVEVM